MPLLVLLAFERSTVDGSRFYGRTLCTQIAAATNSPIILRINGQPSSIHLRYLASCGDAKAQQTSSGNAASGSSHYRCWLCATPNTSWMSGDITGLMSPNVKSVVDNAIDYLIGCTARGILRPDTFLQEATVQSLSNDLTSNGLMHFDRFPDPMHVLENVSQTIMKVLMETVGSKIMKEVIQLMNKHTRITKLTGLIPAYRWRRIWGSYPVTWAVALKTAVYERQRTLIRYISLIASILYAKAEHRTAKSLLRLSGACFVVHRTLAGFTVTNTNEDESDGDSEVEEDDEKADVDPAKGKSEGKGKGKGYIKLSEHLLWPHIPMMYDCIDGYNVSTERHEYLWKAIRAIKGAVDLRTHNPTAVRDLLLRIVVQQFERYHRVRKRDRELNTELKKWWKGAQTERIIVTDDPQPLLELLRVFGFNENEWWHKDKNSVTLHTASNDPNLRSPHLMSVSDYATANQQIRAQQLLSINSLFTVRKAAHNSHPNTCGSNRESTQSQSKRSKSKSKKGKRSKKRKNYDYSDDEADGDMSNADWAGKCVFVMRFSSSKSMLTLHMICSLCRC